MRNAKVSQNPINGPGYSHAAAILNPEARLSTREWSIDPSRTHECGELVGPSGDRAVAAVAIITIVKSTYSYIRQ